MAWLICMFWSRSTFRVFSQCARLKFYISNGFFAITISILERERVVKAYNILHRSASAFSVKMFSQNTRRFFSDFLNTFCAISKRVYVLCVIVSFCFCMRAVRRNSRKCVSYFSPFVRSIERREVIELVLFVSQLVDIPFVAPSRALFALEPLFFHSFAFCACERARVWLWIPIRWTRRTKHAACINK